MPAKGSQFWFDTVWSNNQVCFRFVIFCQWTRILTDVACFGRVDSTTGIVTLVVPSLKPPVATATTVQTIISWWMSTVHKTAYFCYLWRHFCLESARRKLRKRWSLSISAVRWQTSFRSKIPSKIWNFLAFHNFVEPFQNDIISQSRDRLLTNNNQNEAEESESELKSRKSLCILKEEKLWSRALDLGNFDGLFHCKCCHFIRFYFRIFSFSYYFLKIFKTVFQITCMIVGIRSLVCVRLEKRWTFQFRLLSALVWGTGFFVDSQVFSKYCLDWNFVEFDSILT